MLGIKNSLEELSLQLKFECLPLLGFETPLLENEVRQRGECLKIPSVSKQLGKQFQEEMLSGYVGALQVQWAHEKVGYGVFASRKISKGSYVAEYTGVVRRNDLRRCFEPLNDYCVVYPIQDEIGKNFFLDAKDKGNIARFINHSYFPNLLFVYAFCEGMYHRILIAVRSIEKGEQLFYDYGRSYWHVREVPLEINIEERGLKGVS